MDALATVLSGVMGQPVLDLTGFDGAYDYELKWKRPLTASDYGGDVGTDASYIVAAVQEIGLDMKVEDRGIKVMVIDVAEEPSVLSVDYN
jgi:uncharacterized protein (TIGR03435 family)